MNIYLISDTHFGHDREFIYNPRGFNSVEEMNETIIENWNKTVNQDDIVYHLGDLFNSDNTDFINNIIDRLNCKSISLIKGNHDTMMRLDIYRKIDKIKEIKTADEIYYRDRYFYLSHYPTLTADLTSDPKHCVYNLHGHIHTKKKFYEDRPYMYNVSCDSQNCIPISLDKIMEEIDDEIAECFKYI